MFGTNWIKNRYAWSYGAAILLHLLLFVLQTPLKEALLMPPPLAAEPESPPLTFEFVDVPDARPSETAPEQTPLLADRNLISQDQQTEALPQNHLPSSDGVTRAKEAFETAPGVRRAPAQAHPGHAGASGLPAQAQVRQDDNGFNFAEVLRQNPEQARMAREQAALGRPSMPQQTAAMNNSRTRALEQGSLQLSTYAWNYAPYMAYLKRRIDDHIFPPRAFDLGLLEGTTRVRFRIMRDGSLEGLEVLGFEGSAMLRDTSTRAVELSAQFKPLPADFPDDYLEIIGTFEYIVLR